MLDHDPSSRARRQKLWWLVVVPGWTPRPPAPATAAHAGPAGPSPGFSWLGASLSTAQELLDGSERDDSLLQLISAISSRPCARGTCRSASFFLFFSGAEWDMGYLSFVCPHGGASKRLIMGRS